MNLSRNFKENVLVVGYLVLSVGLAVVILLAVWKGRTSARLSNPTGQQVNH